MKSLHALWREPLMHFLLLGAGIFFLYGVLNRGGIDHDPQTIVVDREKLLTYVQYRSNAFDEARFQSLLDALSQQELRRITADYIREESLYREAKAMQLDRFDYVGRQRLIQQLEYVTRGFVESTISISEDDVRNYYATHELEFHDPIRVTFTHVFFSRSLHGAARAKELAVRELHRLNEKRVRFDQAAAHGDPFVYHVNYVAADPLEASDHFGDALTQRLLALTPDDQRWQGPLESPFGFHLVLLTRKFTETARPLNEVREQVETRVRGQLLEAGVQESLDEITKTYKVSLEWDKLQFMKEHQGEADPPALSALTGADQRER